MPSIMGIVFGVLLTSSSQRRDYLRRLLDPRLIGGRFWLFLLLMAPTMQGSGALIAYLAADVKFSADLEVFGSADSLMLFLVFILMSGPLAEELGWRGVLLPALLNRHNALLATVMVGAIWVLWHLPLFWIEGTTQAAQGFFTLHGVQWVIEVMALSVIVSWVYVSTHWSILGAVMIHFMDNLAFSIFAGTDFEREPLAAAVVTLLYVMVAAVIIMRTDSRTLMASRGGNPPKSGLPPASC
jgi:membrane protease YdiL (CAAX protease family)